MILIAWVIILVYAVWVLGLYLTLKPEKPNIIDQSRTDGEITLLIAFRNERERITPLLDSVLILKKKYSGLSICFVDDHSNDNTFELVQDFFSRNEVQVTLLKTPTEGRGKKDSLTFASQYVSTPWIWFSDADCIIPDSFDLDKMLIQTQKSLLVIGPVVYPASKNILREWIRHEALVLSGITHASVCKGKVLMANGANLWVKSEHYKKLTDQGLLQSSELSGDDVYLAQATSKIDLNSLTSVMSDSCYVLTQFPFSLKDWWHQRIRWASKRKHNAETHVFLTGLLILMANTSTLALMLIIPVSSAVSMLSIFFALCVKFIVDLLLLMKSADLLNQRVNVWAVFFLFISYPLYIIAVSLASIFMNYEWKGRTS